MKKEGFLIILLLLGISLNLLINLQEKGMEKVTAGSIIDTMAIFSVSIRVDAGPPSIIIDSPTNKTYFSGNNLPLNYIATDTTGLDTAWYNLDNGENITLTQNITFDTNEGVHTLYLFANDTVGFLNDSEFVSFSVGTPSEEKSVDVNGEVVFDDPSIKEIITKVSGLPTNAEVNATNYNNTIPNGWTAPSSTLVETTLKYLEIIVNEPITETATIYFNLTSDELGSTSPSDIRLFRYDTGWTELTTTVVDSSSDPVSFSAVTTHFSQFIIGKKAVTVSPPTGGVIGSGSTGGGAAGGGAIGPSFSLDQEFLKVQIKRGDMLIKPIKIINTGDTALDFTIDLQELKDVITLSESKFRLDRGKEKLIDLKIIPGKGIAPGVYIGNIHIKTSALLSKLVQTIIEIESEKVLFDISLDIPATHKSINPGQEIIAYPTLLNMGGLTDVEITIEYSIKNNEGKDILKEEENITVGKQATFTKKFLIPKDTPLGEYIFVAVVKYKDSVGTSSETFTVGEFKRGFTTWNIVLIAAVFLSFILITIWQRKKIRTIEKRQLKRVSELESKRTEIPNSIYKERLEKELNLLEKNYKNKYISKEAYEKCKARIESALRKIK